MYVTKLCVRMSYVKRCKKIVCERVVREKWFVNMTKLCVARAWAKLRVRDTRIHLQQWENPGVDPNAR